MWNLFIVVDENDNVVGYKPQEKIDAHKEYYRVSALRLTNIMTSGHEMTKV